MNRCFVHVMLGFETSVIKQPFNDNDWNMIGFNEFDNIRIIPG